MKKLVESWPVVISVVAVILWFAQLQAKVENFERIINDKEKVEQKMWDKFDALQGSVLEVKIGVSKLETILEKTRRTKE